MANPSPEMESHRMFSERSISTRATNHRIEAAPIQNVDHVGVRYLGWILANARGRAPCAAIDSVVRAVGRMVVWVHATAEVMTASDQRHHHDERASQDEDGPDVVGQVVSTVVQPEE